LPLTITEFPNWIAPLHIPGAAEKYLPELQTTKEFMTRKLFTVYTPISSD